MEKWKPAAEGTIQTIRMSNLTYGMLRHFYKKGLDYKVPEKEARYIDQRAFGPAFARGLFDFGVSENGESYYYMTLEGRKFVEEYERRDAWKESPSKEFSHWIRASRHIAKLRRAASKNNLRMIKASA
jgi:hypothetical protein